MNATAILRELSAFYLVVTLTATSLAKMRSWRTASLTLARQSPVPTRLAPAVILTVAVSELLVSTLLALRADLALTGFVAVGLFVAFGCYRLAVAARTRLLTCACVGVAESSPATPHAIAAAVLSCLFQTGVALVLALLARRHAAVGVDPVAVAAWLVPVAALLLGTIVRPRVITARLSR